MTIPATSWTIEKPASLRSDDWPASLRNSGRLQIGMVAAFAGIPKIMRRKFILSEVITRYTLVDEYFNMRITLFFFEKKTNFIRLWKTKRFKLFNYHVLEELPLMAKLRFVKSISKVPKGVAADIERLNALRNGLAHAFFPENLKKSKPEWKGKKIFTVEGLHAFMDDMSKIGNYFLAIPTVLDEEK